MPHYLHQISYSTESIKAMTAKPHDRRTAAAKMFKAAGGKLIDMYFCFGEYDGVAICEFPSNVDAAAVALMFGASGASRIRTTVLIPMDDTVKALEKAGKIAAHYEPPTG